MMEFLWMCLGIATLKKLVAPPHQENDSIGESKVIDGIEYFNIGTLEDEDNWIQVGSVEIQYYVNVYEEDGIYSVRIEDESNSQAIDSMEAMDYTEARRFADMLESVYVPEEVEDFHYY